MIPAAALVLTLTAAQAHWISIAFREGSKYGYGYQTAAIILAESSACRDRRQSDSDSFGCGQLQPETASKMAGHPITPAQLKADNLLSIKLAAKFVAYCHTEFPKDEPRAIICYNRGEFKTRSLSDREIKKLTKHGYIARVLNYMRLLRAIREDKN